ncbi:arginine--tRNA ligase [Chlamydia pecorum]|uniref:Arginine--tRNA ligase n=3 Tax=Chlamydia pecorum TaxID=85991 RepID=A0AA34RD03_CHLPE|nr:arginine--tRNA ligase [Chlamydia pecorum]AEB41473.1 arginyl-tRNA synthetase [Chlamydia pecorum E58]AGW38599.1 arginyl-tRNA synthetase [Chlamydia pecorum W73]AGW39524.1 arginyl-tRNA synthetase [Chlamydia pecorum P787]ETF38823.1 arginyl-tRNA synthetase [Chlamydia pecorum VR629]KTF29232.1 arginine--tRNA ligase [Chlamydia pecorum]
MHSLLSELSVLCHQALSLAFPEVKGWEPEVTPSTKELFGHYQCNDAMKLARVLKQAPRSIAEAIVSHLPHKEFFDSIEIAGAGFINFTFSSKFLTERLNSFSSTLASGLRVEHPQNIVIDFSSPNIAKDMHVGHLRSTIIGECLARILSYVGNSVLRLNHIGDWGTAFGMLIAFIEESPEEANLDNLKDLTELYKRAHKRFAEEEAFKKRAQQRVVALQAQEPQALALWKKICEISEKAFQQIYDILDITLEKRGESFYNPFLPEVIQDLESKHLITLSDKAKCVFHEGFSIPFMVQKSDGGYNYATTDLAAMRYRVEHDHAEKIIIVTDLGQSLHFQLLEATAIAAGYLHPGMFSHVGFGLVLDAEGKKFKTRSGENIKLQELLDTAIEKAREALLSHRPEVTETELEELAPIIGINAIKYADLSSHRVSDYIFSFEKMLRFDGNTAMFLLYAYVRIQGIKRRLHLQELSLSGPLSLQDPAEEALALSLLRFPEALQLTIKELCPHFLTEYLYTLTQKFNRFFRDCHIEGSPLESERLTLCALTEKVLATGMHLLGLRTLSYL